LISMARSVQPPLNGCQGAHGQPLQHAARSSFCRGCNVTRIDETCFSIAWKGRSACIYNTASGEHEKRTAKRDANWPDWYAAYMVEEKAGEGVAAMNAYDVLVVVGAH
jgi:hypothetical protein